MRSIMTLSFLLGFAATAAAATVLVTPPLQLPSSAHFLSCLANNLDNKPRTMTVEIFNTAGTLVATSGSDLVNPGGISGTTSGNLFASYCRITYDGGKKGVRGAMTLQLSQPAGSASIPQVAVAAEAQ